MQGEPAEPRNCCTSPDCEGDCRSGRIKAPIAPGDMDDAVRFHGHLDECPRCAREPFNLCATGHALLVSAAVTGPMVSR